MGYWRLLWLLSSASAAPWTTQPNPPLWPPSVRVFSPHESPVAIEEAVSSAYRQNGGKVPVNHGEFSSARFAFLFKPGTYKVDVPVGYYTQVLGLGMSPDEVVFDSKHGVYCEESNNATIFGSLSTFWRGAENFRTKGSMLWATSQATPVRRAIIDGDLKLSEYNRGVGEGYSSGGFVGNVRVSGTMKAGSQQQYFTRNAELATGSSGGVWNMVFLGTMGAPPNSCGRQGHRAATVTVRETPRIAEKPFISIDEGGKYQLHIPRVAEHRMGPDFSFGKMVPFERVFVANQQHSARAINRKLREGLHVLLSPGIYKLEEALHVGRDNQVLLGIGFPTLVAPEGHPCVRVGNADGVRVSGLLLDAGPGYRASLLEWGKKGYAGDRRNPSFMHDVFARVGGTNDQAKQQVAADVMVRLHAGNVIGDNIWLWRADHGVGGLVRESMNRCNTGLLVEGDHVTMYGLAVEHTLQDLVQWSGDEGRTFFYQSEYPYDVTQANFGDRGYVSYRVNDTVVHHEAYGVGVYHFFRDHPVTVARGISVPPWVATHFQSPLGVYLNGKGRVEHIINDRGAATAKRQDASQAMWFCEKFPDVPLPTSVTSSTSTTSTTSTSTSLTETTVTYTGTQTVSTTTETSTRTATTLTTTTTTTVTTSSTSSTVTSTTGTKTVTSSTTSTSTSTTTTTTMLWFQTLMAEVPAGPLPWLAALVPLNGLLVCALVAGGCLCKKRSRSPSEEAHVPVSRLLSILGSPRAGGRNGAFSPMQGLFEQTPRDTPGRHFDNARKVTVDRTSTGGAFSNPFSRRSSSLLDTSGGNLPRDSPRRGDSPMRQNMARMFSVMSMADSVLSLSPQRRQSVGPAPSPWLRQTTEGEA